jgi:peptidoglycan/LPS O-acetylase OafA/YrhL
MTHMFVVFALFRLFVAAGKPLGGVPILFVSVILAAGLLGEWVARTFSEPMNHSLRRRFSAASGGLGSAIDPNKGRAGCSRQ